ncbi:MAG: class I SAM-dependent methyltransferase [Myxococcales bacterium]|nr:class I SAM-dependent methyltransferase [Myxococcales bacterium]
MEDPVDAALRALGETLGGCPSVRLEWSLRASRRVVERDRCIVWVDAARGEDFAGVASALTRMGADARVRAAQRDAAATSVSQGIGVSRRADGVDYRLYLHHRDPEGAADRYDAFTWAGERVEALRYWFHYLPETPDGEAPAALVHPAMAEATRALASRERMRQIGGFWLRERGGQLDQLYLTCPWHPQLRELAPDLQALAAQLEIDAGWLEALAEHRVRHIGFPARRRGSEASGPQLTVYFSSRRGPTWPETLDALRDQVRAGAERTNARAERRYFARLPARASASPAQDELAAFYDPPDLAPWRAVLGPTLHYHFGLFESQGEAPADDAYEEAQRHAVRTLFPHIPAGARVYDMGCGWGAPAQLLIRERGCQVLGLTLSPGQRRHCAELGVPTRRGDMEDTLPPGRFDCALLLESLSHVRDKARLFEVLRLFTPRLVMRAHCQDGAPPSRRFAETMHMIPSSQLRRLLEERGWKIVHWQDRRAQSMPTIAVWRRRLRSIPKSSDRHLEEFRRWAARVARVPQAWAEQNPLIEVVCTRA